MAETDQYEPPDLGHMSTDDLCAMMLACGMSYDKSDRDFARACRDEITRRKPLPSGDSK